MAMSQDEARKWVADLGSEEVIPLDVQVAYDILRANDITFHVGCSRAFVPSDDETSNEWPNTDRFVE